VSEWITEKEPTMVERIELELSERHATMYFANTKYRVDHDICRDGVRAMITALIPTNWDTEVECKWPKDWWQAFKERFFGSWLRKRYPVKYNHEILKAGTGFPGLKIPMQSSVPIVIKRRGPEHYWDL